jgi:carbon-monoxide dehydrogenase medium subunit
MKLRLAEPAHLIDITRIAGLNEIRDDGDQIAVGALTTHHTIARDPLIRSAVPILAEVASVVGDQQVRNRGTIGGALAHADAAADYPAAILALNAVLVAHGPDGKRTIAAGDFFLDFLTTDLTPEEVLTEVRLPKQAPRSGSSYQKLANQASGYAVVGVAALVSLDGDGAISDVRIGITGTAPAAFRAEAAEAALRGQRPDEATIRAAAELAGAGVDPLSDLHASADYRLHVTRGLTRRALQTAVQRAGRPA